MRALMASLLVPAMAAAAPRRLCSPARAWPAVATTLPATWTAKVGNTRYGIYLPNGNNSTIGGNGIGNTIAGNGQDGIFISGSSTNNGNYGNTIGTNQGDPDVGPNGLQNFPEITAVGSSGSQTQFTGTLNSLPNRTFRIDFYSSPACDPSGYGEGRTYVGWRDVNTNGAGNASFNFTLPIGFRAGWVVAATASDLSAGGQTSEFSQCRQVVAQSFMRAFYLPLIARQAGAQ